MKIKRVLQLAGMVLAAIAFAAPAVAQADVQLTEEGEPLEAGAEVTATSTNFITISEKGGVQCELVTMHFAVEENGPAHVILDPSAEVDFNGCGGIKDATVLTPLTLNTWGTGWAGTTYSTGTCHFSGGVHVEPNGGTDEIDLGFSTLFGSGPFCGIKQLQLAGVFTLETSDGTPVTFDYEETE